jgi:hypothetical protein
MDKVYKITKVAESSSTLPPPTKPKTVKKSTKTYPKSNLKKTQKIIPVQDPARSPPLKKGSRRFTMRLKLNDKHRQQDIQNKVKNMNPEEVKKQLNKINLSNENTPEHLKKEILVGAKLAGFVSS